MRYYYAERNRYGVNLSYYSIGWELLRFPTKQARDEYVDENKWNGCTQVTARIRAKNASKPLGHSLAKVTA